MRIPLLDMKAQLAPIRKEIDCGVARVIDNGDFILGEELRLFEEEVCRYCAVKYAVGVSSGTDAIILSLEALGIGNGDKVICPSFTYNATAAAIASSGAEPVFVDIDLKTYCISAGSIEDYFRRAPSGERKAAKAVIPVHLYGQCVEMDKILEIAKEFDLKVIEDSAQAFGASYKDRKAAAMGDCGIASFYPGKNLGACGDAGMVLTNDGGTADKIRCLRNQGAAPEDRYRHIYAGRNNRLDTIQAAILRVKLKALDGWNNKRAENAAYYNRRLENTGLITPYVPEGNIHIYHQYVLRAKTAAGKEAIVNHLREKGIDSRTYYPIPLHLQPCFSYLGYKRGDIPESEAASRETFAIPVYPELTKEQMDYIVGTITEAL